jgi:heme exporter protein C
MWLWFHKLGSPPHAYRLAERLQPWFLWSSLPLLLIAAVGGLWLVPMDYQQKDAFRIFYVHVPIASMSLGIYMFMAAAAAVGMIWRMKVGYAAAAAAAPIGAAFTLLALITGSIWGRPMWGTWWAWDVRVTTELVLLFFYAGYILLASAFDDITRADRTTAVLAIVGSVNVPIVKYSVVWWNSLHQGSTVLKFGMPAMDRSMLWPFYVVMLGILLYLCAVVCLRVRAEILRRERRVQWVDDVL